MWLIEIISGTWLILYDMAHSYGTNDSYICDTWLIHMWHITHICDMTHPYVWHDSFVCVTWLIHMYVPGLWRMRAHCFICVTWLICMCDMTHSYMWHGSFICVTWLIHMCDMTHAYVWHNSFMCAMSHLNMWHDSFLRVTWLTHTCDATYSYVWRDSFICVSTWFVKEGATRLLGSGAVKSCCKKNISKVSSIMIAHRTHVQLFIYTCAIIIELTFESALSWLHTEHMCNHIYIHVQLL